MQEEKNQFELVKDPDNNKQEYIFQKNMKTKVGSAIVITFLVILTVATIISAIFFFS